MFFKAGIRAPEDRASPVAGVLLRREEVVARLWSEVLCRFWRSKSPVSIVTVASPGGLVISLSKQCVITLLQL